MNEYSDVIGGNYHYFGDRVNGTVTANKSQPRDRFSRGFFCQMIRIVKRTFTSSRKGLSILDPCIVLPFVTQFCIVPFLYFLFTHSYEPHHTQNDRFNRETEEGYG